jgi:hypothetical protein
MAVHPPQHDLVVVHDPRRAVFALASRRPIHARHTVCPRAHDEARAERGAAARGRKPREVRRRAVWAICLVVPAREAQHGRRRAIVLSAQFRPGPPRIVCRMREPFVIPGRNRLEIAHGRQRQRRSQAIFHAVPRHALRKVQPAAAVRRDVVIDPGDPGHVPHAAGVPELRGRGEGHRRHHRLEMRRTLHGGEPLDRSGIRQSERPDRSVGPGLHGGPFDRVVSVAPFLLVGDVLAIGRIASTHILEDHRVPARDRLACRRERRRRLVFSVRRAIHERGISTRCRGAPNVGAQHHAITHGHRHVRVANDRGVLR